MVASVKSLAIFAFTLIIGNSAATAMVPDTPELHGKPTIRLTKTLTRPVLAGGGVAWSPDGSVLAVSSGTTVTTFDSSGHQLSTFTNRNGNRGGIRNSLLFVNGSSQILFPIENVAPVDAALDIRDVKTGRIVDTLKAREPRKEYSANGTSNFAIAPDRKHLAIANGYAPATIIFGTDDGSHWRELSIAKAPELLPVMGKRRWFGYTSLCFFPDSKLLAVGKTEGRFAVVDSSTGETLKEFQSYDSKFFDINIDAMAVSPAGDLLLTGMNGIATAPNVPPEAWAWDKNHARVSIWRASDGKKIASFNGTGDIRQALWDPKDRFVAFADRDEDGYHLILWQPKVDGKSFIRITFLEVPKTFFSVLEGKIITIDPNVTDLTFALSPDGNLLAVAGGDSVTVYHIETN